MTGPLEQLADQWDEGLPGSPEETCAMRACAAQLRDALRAQAEADKGLREALAHYAELRHYDHAGRLWSGNPDEHEDAQVDFGEIARAALAQGVIREEP